MYAMDVDEEVQLPGGDGFRDVTSVFASASKEMEPGSMVTIEGFSLQDAMSAIEIGEPRLDTGIKLNTVERPQFDPLTPLLPEEVCWIIDRSMAYEMEWHASSPLSHTIFTMMHVHFIQDIDPDVLPYLPMMDIDPTRPLYLITVVLRAYVCGLLKCCDMAWRELSKGGLYDTEDWQSDKCEVSLLEGWPAKAALARLDSAITWLSSTTKVSSRWQEALNARLMFRKTILELMASNIFHDSEHFVKLIGQARRFLASIRASLAPEPSAEAAAHASFDPYIARRLNTFLPVRVINPPSPSQTCAAYDNILSGLEELSKLGETYCISTWELVGYQRSWLANNPARPAYIRSCSQSMFYDGIQVLNSRPQGWIVDRFFTETLGVPYKDVARYWGGPGGASLLEFERTVIHTLIPHIRSLWCNLPRRRRFLAKSLLDWHMVYDQISVLVEDLEISDLAPHQTQLLNQLPTAATVWRLSSMREVILSGFQLELYHPMERPFAYWFAAQVIEAHLACLDDFVPQSAPSQKELEYQQAFLTALQAMSTAMFVSLTRSLPENATYDKWEQLRPNLRRRYKWAFNSQYDEFEFSPVASPPDFVLYLTAVKEVYNMDIHENSGGSSSRSSSMSSFAPFELAERLLEELIRSENVGGWADQWAGDRLTFLRALADTCQELQRTGVDYSVLDWSCRKTPWFPSRRSESDS